MVEKSGFFDIRYMAEYLIWLYLLPDTENCQISDQFCHNFHYFLFFLQNIEKFKLVAQKKQCLKL
jgi:hypothetical protein